MEAWKTVCEDHREEGKMEGDWNDAGMQGRGEKEGRDGGKQARREEDQRKKTERQKPPILQDL